MITIIALYRQPSVLNWVSIFEETKKLTDLFCSSVYILSVLLDDSSLISKKRERDIYSDVAPSARCIFMTATLST